MIIHVHVERMTSRPLHHLYHVTLAVCDPALNKDKCRGGVHAMCPPAGGWLAWGDKPVYMT